MLAERRGLGDAPRALAKITRVLPKQHARRDGDKTARTIDPYGLVARRGLGAESLEWAAAFLAGLNAELLVVARHELRPQLAALGMRLLASAQA